MSQKTERNVKKSIVNFFGSFGYLFCFLQWFWAIILYFSVFQSLSLFISSGNDKQVEQPPVFTFTQPDTLGIIVIAVIVVIMIAITIYALINIPRNIVKTGNKIVHRTAETVAPIVIEATHKQDTKKARTKMSLKLTLATKLLLIFIPLVLTAASGLLEEQSIDYLVALIIDSVLACFSLVAFTTQYLLARILHVKISSQV